MKQCSRKASLIHVRGTIVRLPEQRRALRLQRGLLSVLLHLALVTGCVRRPPPLPLPPNSVRVDPARPALSAVEERARLVAAAQMDPNNPGAALALARFDVQTGRPSIAERELVELGRRFPGSAEAAFQLGMLYLNERRYDAALPVLQRAATLAPDRGDAQLMAGLANFRSGRLADAQRCVNRAARLTRDAPDVYLLQAQIYSGSGAPDRAMAALQDYFKRAREPEPGQYLMGRLYFRQADPVNAELWLKRAIAAKGDDPDAWSVLGRVYAELDNGRRVDEGIQCYTKSLALRPDDWETHAAIGRALMRKHQWEDAIGHLRTAVRTAPNPGPILYTLAQALLQGGHIEDGKRMLAQYRAYTDYSNKSAKLKREIEEAPRDRSRRYALARVCITYRQFAAAEAVLAEAAYKLGSDATLRGLQAQVEAGLTARSSRAPANSQGQQPE